jgi:hypothetical protein
MKKHITTQDVPAFLEEYNILIRAIPGEVWTLSVDTPLNRNTPYRTYRLTETESKRIKIGGAEPRIYTSTDLCEVLLAFLGNAAWNQENRGPKFQARYPIPENSNIIRISPRKRGHQ